jgi:hypothetical protein
VWHHCPPSGAWRRAEWTEARRIITRLEALIERRGGADLMRLREACAGGCAGSSLNVSVTLHALPPPGKHPGHVAIGWRTYVSSLATLPCLAAVIDDHAAAVAADATPASNAAR